MLFVFTGKPSFALPYLEARTDMLADAPPALAPMSKVEQQSAFRERETGDFEGGPVFWGVFNRSAEGSVGFCATKVGQDNQ